MLIHIVDSLETEVCTVTFRDDQTFELVRRGWIFVRTVGGRDRQYMLHTRLLEAINEIAT